MGICQSVICSKKDDAVEIHKRQNALRLKEAAESAPNVSNSVELIDIESREESPSEVSSSSTLSENERNIALPQEELDALKICGTPWPPGRDNDVVEPKVCQMKFSFTPTEERQLEKDNKKVGSKSPPKESSQAGPSPVRHFGYSGPPPRPQPWKEVYLTMIKPKEKQADESMRAKGLRNRDRKKINRQDQIRALRKHLDLKISSIKRRSSYIRRHNTPEEQGKLGVADCGMDDSDESSFESVSPASTTSSSTASDSSSITSDDSFEFEESRISHYNRGDDESTVKNAHRKMLPNANIDHTQKGVGKSWRMLGQKRNKVFPM